MREFNRLTDIDSASSDVVPPSVDFPRRGEILLIEDRDDVREGLAQLLELHGFLVTEVADGDHGMRELVEHTDAFALIVLDLLLPGSLSGIAFRKQQLEDERLSKVPTIVVTSADLMIAEREPLQADGWLEKPFRFDTLLALVKRYVVPEGRGLRAEMGDEL